MASISRYPRSPYWFACYRDAAGKQRRRSTKIPVSAETPKLRAMNKRDALTLAQEMENLERGDPLERQLRRFVRDVTARLGRSPEERVTARGFLEDWVERKAKTVAGNTGHKYRATVAAFLETLGGRAEAAVADISPVDIQRFSDELSGRDKEPSTVRTYVRTIKSAFSQAAKLGVVPEDPSLHVSLPQGKPEGKKPFTAGQLRALIEAAEGEMKTFTLVAAYTGLRAGDAASLRWENVDLPSGVITVRPQKTRRFKKDLVIPLHPLLSEHLLSLPAPDDPGAMVTPGIGASRVSRVSNAFHALVARAGIENTTVSVGRRKKFKYGAHSLRATFTSLLANADVAGDLRQKLTGHTDSDTHAVYTHWDVETFRRAIDKLPS